MRLTVLSLLFVSLSFSHTVYGQTKKVKIKDEKHTTFTYESDSSCLKHGENKELLKSFYAFFHAVETDNYVNYKSYLSAATLEEIPELKLQRKFEKFKGYNVRLSEDVRVRSVSLFDGKTTEKNPVYICVVELPDDQSIEQRVGFDPLKREKFEDVNGHVGLHFTKSDDGSYRVVILW